eukprot:47916-Chlamydomonas_euryale.AAC.1
MHTRGSKARAKRCPMPHRMLGKLGLTTAAYKSISTMQCSASFCIAAVQSIHCLSRVAQYG